MRTIVLALLALTVALAGGSCLPLVDTTRSAPETSRTMAIVVSEPDADATVAAETPVRIRWTASNLSGGTGTITLIAESRTDLTRTTLQADVAITGTGGNGEYTWETTGFSGPYAIYAQLASGGELAEAQAAGLVTIDPPATFEFTAPTTDQEFIKGETTSLAISYIGADNDATVTLGLDPDLLHGSGSSGDADDDDDSKSKRIAKEDTGNEIFIGEIELTSPTATAGTFTWAGKNTGGADVEDGTYYLFASVSDGINSDFIVNGLAQITVSTEEEEEDELTFDEPDDDAEFLRTDPTFDLVYRVNSSQDALVDVVLDPDEADGNGNEYLLLSQQSVPADTDPPTFEWNGLDSAGLDVPDGIYRPFMAVTFVGSTTPQTAFAEGLVFRRTTENQPLVGLLKPGGQLKVTAGQYVNIAWRDDTPAEIDDDGNVIQVPAADKAHVRLWIDDDPDPAEVTETGRAEIALPMPPREAVLDDVYDTYNWRVPASLRAGTYYLFAYIYRGDPSNPHDHVSVAGGRIIVLEEDE